MKEITIKTEHEVEIATPEAVATMIRIYGHAFVFRQGGGRPDLLLDPRDVLIHSEGPQK